MDGDLITAEAQQARDLLKLALDDDIVAAPLTDHTKCLLQLVRIMRRSYQIPKDPTP